MSVSASLAPPPARQHAGAQQPRPLPEAIERVEGPRNPEQRVPELAPEMWIAEELGEDDRRENGLPLLERDPHRLHVGAGGAGQIRDEGARVDGDHRRSSRRWPRSTENRTLPRRVRRRW